jgi:hypothetical protein
MAWKRRNNGEEMKMKIEIIIINEKPKWRGENNEKNQYET